MAGSVLARPAQGRVEDPLTGPARLLQRARVRSAWGGWGSRWGSCHRPGAAATARSARQDAQGGAVALGQGQGRAGMGRARVGVPPGERRLRAAHVERVGAAAVGGLRTPPERLAGHVERGWLGGAAATEGGAHSGAAGP